MSGDRVSLSKVVFLAIIMMTISTFLMNSDNWGNIATCYGIILNSVALLYLNLSVIKAGISDTPNYSTL